jgi:hypothetical protein
LVDQANVVVAPLRTVSNDRQSKSSYAISLGTSLLPTCYVPRGCDPTVVTVVTRRRNLFGYTKGQRQPQPANDCHPTRLPNEKCGESRSVPLILAELRRHPCVTQPVTISTAGKRQFRKNCLFPRPGGRAGAWIHLADHCKQSVEEFARDLLTHTARNMFRVALKFLGRNLGPVPI